MKQTATPPVNVIRYGNIKASIWINVTRNGPMYNVTLSRSYKDGDEWKDSSSFGADDLLLVAKIANECHTWIHSQKTTKSQVDGSGR